MAPNGFWEIEGEPYTTAPGVFVSLVPVANWWAHKPLGAHCSAIWPCGFQIALNGWSGR